MSDKKFSLKKIFSKESAQKIGAGVRKGYVSVVPQKNDDPEKWFFKLQIFSILGIAIFVVIAGISVFLLTLKEPEDVVVPKVLNLELSDSILLLQKAGLSNEIEVKFHTDPKSKGLVIEQIPTEGNSLKAGRKVKLIVSKGANLEKIDDYTRKNIEEVQENLRILFGSNPPLIIIDSITYQDDSNPAGTILSQNPPPETKISGPTKISLVVSKGMDTQNIKVPNLKGLSIQDAISSLSGLGLNFELTLDKTENTGKVIEQSPEAGTELGNANRVSLVFSAPKAPEGKTFALVVAKLPEYEVPTELIIKMKDPKGFQTTVYRYKTLGGQVQVPILFAPNTSVSFYVLEKEIVAVKADDFVVSQ